LEKALQKLATSELSEDDSHWSEKRSTRSRQWLRSVVELTRVPRSVPELVARLERIGSRAGVSQNRRVKKRKPAPRSALSREADGEAAEELAAIEPDASLLDDLDLDITLERRQRRLDDDPRS